MRSKTLSVRRLVLVPAVLCALLAGAVSLAFAGPPNAGQETISHYGFESPTDNFTTGGYYAKVLPADADTTAFWGRRAEASHTGAAGLWCAGTVSSTGNPSTSWPNYPEGTRGFAKTKFTQLADYYSVGASMDYKMVSVGADDVFRLYWRTYDGSDNTINYRYDELPVAASWTNVTVDMSSPADSFRLSRTPAEMILWFYDSSGLAPAVGTGPSVDDFTVSGYKYGPIRSVSIASPAEGQVDLTWPVPYRAIGSNVNENRSVTYRVWRAEQGTDVWVELTSDGGRLTANTFTDVTTSPGTLYKYVVQAWDPGTGSGRGEQSTAVGWPAQLTLGAPSKPSGTVYTWKSFTSVGTVEPGLAGGSSTAIQCSRDKTAIARTYTGTVGAGGTTYSVSGVSLPAAGTWYIRAYHSDSTYGVSKSDWTTVQVSAAAKITAPSVKSTMSLNKTYTVSGTVMPRHSSTTAKYLKVRAYRLSGASYAYVKSFSVKVTSTGQPADTTKYTASVRLTKTGSWKLRVKHSAHGVEATSYSSYSSKITVK